MALLSKDIDFMSPRKRRITGTLSTIFIVIALLSLMFNRLQLGLDFTSGTLIELGYEQPVEPSAIAATLQHSARTVMY